MKIAFNPLGSGALTKAPDNKDITFDLVGRVIYARGVPFDGKNTQYKTFKKHTSSDNTGGSEGLVPIPSYSTTNTRLLREDGQWVNIAGAAPPDTELSTESTNTVQNKVITNKINEILASMQLKAADVYKNIKVGTTTLVASGVNDTLEFKLGNGITITPNATNKTLEFSINATGNQGISTSYSNKQLIVKIQDEYYNKWNAVYDWYISVTEEDTDDLINKWQEIVDFLNSVAEGTDILDEFVTRKTAQTITGVKTFNTQQKFTVADGTSPFTVTSKTLVTNLNVDLLDGYHSTKFPLLNGVKSGTWDWNDVLRAGYYKIQSGTITNHPSGIYQYGMAAVLTTEDHADGENRELQLYYPHNQTNSIAIWGRMHNSATQGSGWGSWWGIPTTAYINTTNFPGLNKTGTVTSVTVTGANGLSGTGTITTSGTITLSNVGVRSTTINGNYLRINTNGTNTDLTIPYATKTKYWNFNDIGSLDFDTMYGDNYRGTAWYGGGSNSAVNNPLGDGTAFGMQIWRNASGYTAQLIMTSAGKLTSRYWGGSNWSSLKTFAYTSDIPTVTNYYWADQKISSSSNAATSPTVALLKATTGVQIGGTADIGWYLSNSRICAGNSTARGVNVGSLLVSNAWADYSKVPTNGIYSKGTIQTAGGLIVGTTIFLNTGDPTLKMYSGKITNAKSDGNICFQTCINGQDGQSHNYAVDHQARNNIVLQPRGGQVYIGTNPDGGNTNYKLYVNGKIFSTGFVKSGSSDSYVLLGGGGHKTLSDFAMASAYVKKSGDTMTGPLHLAYATSATMTTSSTNPQIIFSEGGGQKVQLMYTDYDSYRLPAGLKVLGEQGGEWFEVVGNIYSGGYFISTANGKTIQIGSQNTTYCHYSTSANLHYFNKSMEVDGYIAPYGNNAHSSGTSTYRWSNVYSVLGNFSGAVSFANGTWNPVGDDTAMGDCNRAGLLGIKSLNNNLPGIAFFNSSGTQIGSLYSNASVPKWSGNTIYHSGNLTKSTIGLGNVQNTAFYKRSTSVNGTAWDMAGTVNSAAFTIFAPTTVGSSGQLLKSNGSGAPTWVNQNTITSGYTNYLKILDVRGTNHLPNSSTYPANNITAWFNNTGTPNSNWWSGITVKGWSNTYAVWQLCSYSSTGTANNYRLYHRNGINDGWGSWKAIAYTSDIPSIPSISISNSGSGNAVTSITASGHTVTVTKGKNFFTHLGTDNKASVWSWGTVSGTSGWNSTASDRGYRGQYGTNLDISGFSTWYHRFAMCTDGRVEYWLGINTKTLTKRGVLAWTSDIPSVGNGTVTIKQAGATKGSFTMNQSGNTTIELTDNNTTYSFSNSNPTLSWGTKSTIGTVGGVALTVTMPANPNTDTHWTTRIYAGASGTAAHATATNPYLKVTDNNTYRNQVRFVGGGATTVSSNTSGNITISSTNTWRGIQNNLTSSSTTESLSANMGKLLASYKTGTPTYNTSNTSSGALQIRQWGPFVNICGKIKLTQYNVSDSNSYIAFTLPSTIGPPVAAVGFHITYYSNSADADRGCLLYCESGSRTFYYRYNELTNSPLVYINISYFSETSTFTLTKL